MVIGALACPREIKSLLTQKINLLRKEHETWREFGWKTLSPNRRDFYWALMKLFADTPDLTFRCLVVDRTILDHDKFNQRRKQQGQVYRACCPKLFEKKIVQCDTE